MPERQHVVVITPLAAEMFPSQFALVDIMREDGAVQARQRQIVLCPMEEVLTGSQGGPGAG